MPLDFETVAESVRKTGRLVAVTEAPCFGSIASEVAARIQETVFDWLAAPVMRVGAKHAPIAHSPDAVRGRPPAGRGHRPCRARPGLAGRRMTPTDRHRRRTRSATRSSRRSTSAGRGRRPAGPAGHPGAGPRGDAGRPGRRGHDEPVDRRAHRGPRRRRARDRACREPGSTRSTSRPLVRAGLYRLPHARLLHERGRDTRPRAHPRRSSGDIVDGGPAGARTDFTGWRALASHPPARRADRRRRRRRTDRAGRDGSPPAVRQSRRHVRPVRGLGAGAGGARRVPRRAPCAASDIVTLHMPLTAGDPRHDRRPASSRSCPTARSS